MGDCPAVRFEAEVRIPALALRPPAELEIEHAQADWEAWSELGFEQHLALPGVHGSSMLNAARVDGDVEPTWDVVLGFLERVTRRP